MSGTILIGQPAIQVHLRRSARARRYSLRISNADGRVSLTMPDRGSKRAALAFANRKETWLRAVLDRIPAAVCLNFGTVIPLAGQDVVIKPGAGRRVCLTDGELLVPGPPATIGPKVRGFLKVRARERLAGASQRYADLLGRPVARISLRDTRSRWGSCTADGNLMFSWRLIMAPPGVLDYVAAHEVAHLVELNHSAKFWTNVAVLMPDYDAHRHWLKQNGASLHRYRFTVDT